MGRLAGSVLWSDLAMEETAVTTEKTSWALVISMPCAQEQGHVPSGGHLGRRDSTFSSRLWRTLCCGQISGFGQLIRKFLRLGEYPLKSFCFKEGCKKNSGLIKTGLVEVRRSHLREGLSGWAGCGGRL